MKIVICIKPIRSDLVNISLRQLDTYLINPYDLYALERVLELKRQLDCEVVCVSMGAKGAACVLTRAYAMGVDKAILLNDSVFSGADTVATSYALAKAIGMIEYVGFVVFGGRSIDGETGQVVYGVSDLLQLRCISDIERIIDVKDGQITAECNVGTENVILRAGYPLALAFSNFSLEYSGVSLLALKRARNKEIIYWGASDINAAPEKCGIAGSKTRVLEIKNDIDKKNSIVATGTVKEKAEQILNILGWAAHPQPKPSSRT